MINMWKMIFASKPDKYSLPEESVFMIISFFENVREKELFNILLNLEILHNFIHRIEDVKNRFIYHPYFKPRVSRV